MKNKSALIAVGIVLGGMLLYFPLSGDQPATPDPVREEPTLSGAGDQSILSDAPTVEEHLPVQGPAAGSGDGSAVSGVSVPVVHQQTPALEPAIREALRKRLNTSSEGLVEETRNGVTSVDLRGRFRTAPVATVDKDGNVQITDYSHLPGVPPQP